MSDSHPLPKLGNHSIYVWGGLLGVALLGYMWYANRSSSANAATTTSTTDPTLGSGALGSNSGTVDNSGAADTSPTTDSSSTDSNQSWETRAIAYLVSLGVGGEAAQQLIEQYLAGYKTSYQGHLRLNQVIAHLGPPPEGTDAIPGWNPPPKPKPATDTKPKPKPKKRKKIKPKPKPKKRRKITPKRRPRRRTRTSSVGFRK